MPYSKVTIEHNTKSYTLLIHTWKDSLKKILEHLTHVYSFNVFMCVVVLGSALSSKDWRSAQLQDPEMSQIHQLIREFYDFEPISPIDKYRRDFEILVIRSGVLHQMGQDNSQEYLRLVLPEKLRDDAFRALHDDLGHQGRDRTSSLSK